MEKEKYNNQIVSKVKMYRNVMIIFIAVCILSVIFSFQYYKKLHYTIREESENYLQEVSRRIGSNIDRIIEVNFSGLRTMAASFETENIHSFSKLQPILEKQSIFWDYETVMLIDESGKIYSLDNKEIFLNMDESVRKDILNKNESMCTTQLINNEEYIIFSIPVENVVMDGKNIIALAASYAPSSFDQVLSMTSFNEKAYSQIVTKSGTVVTRPTSSAALNTGYNVFSSLGAAKVDQGYNLEQVKKDIEGDKAGQIGLTLSGSHRYMVYMPIEPEDWYLLTFVPVEVVNEKSDMLLRSTILICCLITIIFVALIGVILFFFTTNRRKLEKIAYVDEITEGNNQKRFYQIAGNLLATNQNMRFALVYTNIQNFKVLNEQLGRQNCDGMLKMFNDLISATLSDYECMGRISADNFCVLLQYRGEEELVERFTLWYGSSQSAVTRGNLLWTTPFTEFGIYVIENKSLTFHQMIDRAKLALKESPHVIENKVRYAFYDDQARRRLFREKQLEDMMLDSLEKEEFQVYLQPKYSLPEEKVGGAEALVRWQSRSEGMIYPDEFISLFEKNGFIVQLDIWVFEQVCRAIQSWRQRGLPVVKVSVNCSRVHFKDPDFLAPYIKIASKYGIRKNDVEIELTESIWLKNEDLLLKVIEKIREAGFGCSMDDFGSGYSSLNMIQSIPVDTLKIDKIFFQGSYADADRTEAVVGSVIAMSKALNMETVAEGVEYREQVEMLERAGCDFIQGYVFAKPMPIAAFEKLAFEEGK